MAEVSAILTKCQMLNGLKNTGPKKASACYDLGGVITDSLSVQVEHTPGSQFHLPNLVTVPLYIPGGVGSQH